MGAQLFCVARTDYVVRVGEAKKSSITLLFFIKLPLASL